MQDRVAEPSSTNTGCEHAAAAQCMEVHALQGRHVLPCPTGTATVSMVDTAGRSAAALGAAEAVAVALHAVARHAVLAVALGALVPVLLHELGAQRVVQLHGVLRIQGITFLLWSATVPAFSASPVHS